MKIKRRFKPVKRKNVTLRYKFKYERRQKAYKFGQFFAVTALAALTLFFGYKGISNFLFCSECFKIKSVEIRGGKNISESEIEALVPFRKGDNIFKANVSATEENLRQCKPELKRLDVSRVWQGIVVSFEEREPVAFIKSGGERLGIDHENKPFPLRGQFARKTLPEIVAKDATGRAEVLAFMKAFAAKAKDIYPQIVRLYPEPVNCVVFELADGLKVFWGGCEEEMIGRKLEKLNQVVFDANERFKAIEYVNMCYYDDGRIIVKPKKT